VVEVDAGRAAPHEGRVALMHLLRSEVAGGSTQARRERARFAGSSCCRRGPSQRCRLPLYPGSVNAKLRRSTC